ncbi:MAG: hypothetical protein A4S09_13730 [Proteobacteria bacterium SG_bin7]|nr:MAG: hypothetical protein A4S09_13730 [Proteobacteria bacterium SG_bin7]
MREIQLFGYSSVNSYTIIGKHIDKYVKITYYLNYVRQESWRQLAELIRQHSRSKGCCTEVHTIESNEDREAELREQVGRNASEAIELRHVFESVGAETVFYVEGNTQAGGSARSDPPESECMAYLQKLTLEPGRSRRG